MLWLGYQLSRREKRFETLSFAAGLLGSGIVGSAPRFGGPLIAFAVIVFGSLLYWRSKSDSSDDTLAARELLLEESLSPILEQLADAAPQPAAQRRETAKRLAERACTELAAKAFATIPGVRVCVFVISDDAKQMACAAKAGRNQRPKSFDRGTDRGDKAFEVLNNPLPYLFAADLDNTSAQDEWAGSGDGYRTFITAPIRSSDTGFGLLTIDAPKAGDLDDRHGRTIALYAAALAVAYAEATRSPGRVKSANDDGRSGA